MRTSKFITISLPPEQLKTAERLARKQNRTMSELFREGLRRLEQEEQSQPTMAAILALLRAEAKAKGLDRMSKREIDNEIAAARRDRSTKSAKPSRR